MKVTKLTLINHGSVTDAVSSSSGEEDVLVVVVDVEDVLVVVVVEVDDVDEVVSSSPINVIQSFTTVDVISERDISPDIY